MKKGATILKTQRVSQKEMNRLADSFTLLKDKMERVWGGDGPIINDPSRVPIND